MQNKQNFQAYFALCLTAKNKQHFYAKLLSANSRFVLVVFKVLKIKVFCLLFILFD